MTSNSELFRWMAPKRAERLRKLDMAKFKEVLKRKFLEGPGSNQSSWEPEYGGFGYGKGQEQGVGLQALLDSSPINLRAAIAGAHREWYLLPLDRFEAARCGFGYLHGQALWAKCFACVMERSGCVLGGGPSMRVVKRQQKGMWQWRWRSRLVWAF